MTKINSPPQDTGPSAMLDDSTSQPTEISKSTSSTTQRTVHAYHMNVPEFSLASSQTQTPEPVYLAATNIKHHTSEIDAHQPTLLNVIDHVARPVLSPRSPSIASSGLSVHEVQAKPLLLDAALQCPPGVYKFSVGHSQSTFGGDSSCLLEKGSDVSEDGQVPLESNRPTVKFVMQPMETLIDKIATQDNLQKLIDQHPLPGISGAHHKNQARYLWLTLYRRLMITVLFANMIAIATLAGLNCRKSSPFTYQQAATGCGANLVVGVLMRQEHVINLLFHVACALPRWVPLQIRRNAAKLAYNNGGVHAGCGNSAFLWFIAYTVLLVQQFRGTTSQERAVAATAAMTLALFVIIIGMAHPEMRRRFHDYWELSHRYCGWTAIGVIWCQTIILAVASAHQSHRSIGLVLVRNPVFWFLVIITLCLIYPWLWLRRLPVDANQLSSHATELRFYNRDVSTCVGTRLSTNPLVENHGFATISHGKGVKGYSVIVSNAGDFTKKLIEDPPTHIWQRGAPTTGVMRVASMFSPIVVVATGSGIGPCLSFLNRHREHKMRIIWSARFPEATYQRGVVEDVLRADKDAIIIDTKKTGHPKLPALAYALYKEIQAEAIAIISNPKVTRDVVYEMEARKVPAFGAIFDS